MGSPNCRSGRAVLPGPSRSPKVRVQPAAEGQLFNCRIFGTRFDASEATNLSLLALLTDGPPPPYDRLICDTPTYTRSLSFVEGGAEVRALQVLGNR